jgi:hypothetical protein
MLRSERKFPTPPMMRVRNTGGSWMHPGAVRWRAGALAFRRSIVCTVRGGRKLRALVLWLRQGWMGEF